VQDFFYIARKNFWGKQAIKWEFRKTEPVFPYISGCFSAKLPFIVCSTFFAPVCAEKRFFHYISGFIMRFAKTGRPHA
jgi:hypothetical protein